jgi:hypothetical protein
VNWRCIGCATHRAARNIGGDRLAQGQVGSLAGVQPRRCSSSLKSTMMAAVTSTLDGVRTRAA